MALRPTGEETLTGTGLAQGFTVPGTSTLMARVHHRSGGGAHYNVFSDPTAAGGAGDFPIDIGEEIEVWGDRSLNGFKVIERTAEAAYDIAVQYFGEGAGRGT